MIRYKRRFLLCGLVIAVLASIMLVVGLAGCDTIPTTGNQASGTVIDSVREQVEQTEEIASASGRVSGHLSDIDRSANLILYEAAGLDGTLVSRMEAHAIDIRNATIEAQKDQVRVEEAIEDLSAANDRMLVATGTIADMEALIAEYEKTDREYREESIKSMREFTSLAFALGFLMCVGGAFVALKIDGRLGSSIVLVGVFAIGFAAASQYYLEEIAKIGLVAFIVGFVGVSIFIIRNMMQGQSAVLAVREIVELIEEIKDYMSNKDLSDMRKEIFGPEGFANQFTSETAKRIIAEIKAKNHFEKLSRKDKGSL